MRSKGFCSPANAGLPSFVFLSEDEGPLLTRQFTELPPFTVAPFAFFPKACLIGKKDSEENEVTGGVSAASVRFESLRAGF